MCAYSSIATELKSLSIHTMFLSRLFWTTLLACLTLGSVNVTSFCAEERDPLCALERVPAKVCDTLALSLALRLAQCEPRARQSSGAAQAVAAPHTDGKQMLSRAWVDDAQKPFE